MGRTEASVAKAWELEPERVSSSLSVSSDTTSWPFRGSVIVLDGFVLAVEETELVVASVVVVGGIGSSGGNSSDGVFEPVARDVAMVGDGSGVSFGGSGTGASIDVSEHGAGVVFTVGVGA